MKKIYQNPEIKVISLKPRRFIASSPNVGLDKSGSVAAGDVDAPDMDVDNEW